MAERPRNFSINRGHPLARDLVFAGLGNPGGIISTHYQDSSLYRNHGALTNMDPSTDWLWVPQLGRWALDFDGSNDCATLPDITVDDYTISAWMIERAYASTTSALLSYDNYPASPRYEHQVKSGTATYLFWYCGGASTATVDGCYLTWKAYSFRRTGGTAQAFCNGVATGGALSVGTGTWPLSYGRLAAHYYSGSNQEFLSCQIADVLIHRRALSDSEIAILSDRSNAMLGGLLMPPRRRYFRCAVVGEEVEAALGLGMTATFGASNVADRLGTLALAVRESFVPSDVASILASVGLGAKLSMLSAAIADILGPLVFGAKQGFAVSNVAARLATLALNPVLDMAQACVAWRIASLSLALREALKFAPGTIEAALGHRIHASGLPPEVQAAIQRADKIIQDLYSELKTIKSRLTAGGH